MPLPDITGKFGAPKPWQYAVAGCVVVGFIFTAPAITHLLSSKKKASEVQLTQVGQIGQAWHPVAWPAAVREMPRDVVIPPPPAAPPAPAAKPAAITPVAANTLVPTGRTDGKKEVDPEQEAINAPIAISASAGQSQAAPTSGGGTRSASLQGGSNGGEGRAEPGSMSAMLKPTETSGFRASVMRHPEMTIEQGRIIACNSVTPMTSSLPGFVKAKVTYDVWSADGAVKLIDHDSTIFGEIQHGLANGQERLFVLWRSIMTPAPNLVRITLNSPAADEMGESGVPGDVDHHRRQKIEGAVLLSAIDMLFSGISSGISGALSGRNGNNNQNQGINLNFGSAAQSGPNLASQMLQSQIQIPDTLHRDQALACSIFVASDLNFSDVYSVRRR